MMYTSKIKYWNWRCRSNFKVKFE